MSIATYEDHDIQFPFGYRFVLYDVQTRTGDKYVLADTPQRAVLLAGRDGGRAIPVSVTEIINSRGHQETHCFLKRFGQEWAVKEGRAFFRNGPRAF